MKNPKGFLETVIFIRSVSDEVTEIVKIRKKETSLPGIWNFRLYMGKDVFIVYKKTPE